jgi:NitT/TauT family transport system ATP-binding protein
MTLVLECGFLPLTDAAPLIIAAEMGFAEEEGIALRLQRENNWASIRDKIAFGIYPVAHMLSPMALAMSLGLGPVNTTIDVPIVLNMNGNALVASHTFTDRLKEADVRFNDPASVGRALIRLGRQERIRIGVPFMQSMHVAMLRFLITQLGVQPSEVIDFKVAPPPLLGHVLAANEVDAFMVGAPWGSKAVEDGVAQLILNSSTLWNAAPEKVLGVNRHWSDNNPDLLDRFLRALHRAGVWIANNRSTEALGEILAKPKYIDVNADIIEQALHGRLALNQSGSFVMDPLAIRFGDTSISFPWQSGAVWIAHNEANSWGVSREQAHTAALDCFRPDIYRRALAGIGAPLPLGDQKVEGLFGVAETVPSYNDLLLGPDRFFDGTVFDLTNL